MGNYLSAASRLSDHLLLVKTVADRQARRQLARHVLTDLLGREAGIEYDVQGKPLLSCGTLHINFAHRDGLLLVGTAGSDIGVDIELIQPGLEVARHHFSRAEYGWLAQTDQPDAFTRLWTAKEAVLKAAGFGIVSGMAEPDFAPFLSPGLPFDADRCEVTYAGCAYGISWHAIEDPCRPALACAAIRHARDTFPCFTLPTPAPHPVAAQAG